MSPLPHSRTPQSLYVSAPVNALVEGLYQENTTIGDILERGDFGIGTFNDLDGEMLVLDGQVYQLDARGGVNLVGAEVRTPFACVTTFRADTSEELDHPMDWLTFEQLLKDMLPSPNMIYALRIEGRFSFVRTRSVPRQENYRPLVEVAREQALFEFQDCSGVLVGFWTPAFLGAVAVPGIHLHYLDAQRRGGGHLMECRPVSVTVAVQHLPEIRLGLPVTLDYLTADFTRDTEKDLDEAEH